MRLGPHDDLELLDSLDHAPTTLDDRDLDDEDDDPDDIAPLSEREEAFARRMNGQPYKPALRQVSKRQQTLCAQAEPSWWTKPDADFAREAERMAMDPLARKVSGSRLPIGWGGVF